MGLSGLRHAPAAFFPGKRPRTHYTGGWVGPRAGTENRTPTGIRSPDRPDRSLVTTRTELCMTPFISYCYIHHLYHLAHRNPKALCFTALLLLSLFAKLLPPPLNIVTIIPVSRLPPPPTLRCVYYCKGLNLRLN
jgi:hypothetical protein